MTVSIGLDGPVAILTLDHQEHHNALSNALVGDLLDAISELDFQSARAIVVAGRGRFFSAGANVPDLLGSGWLSGGEDARDPVTLFQTLASHRLPTIAAVGGPAIGGGFELCLSCDLAVAAENAWFAAPELGLGVIPNTALGRLGAIVGRRRAFEIATTRRRIPADEALALGLVNEVVPADGVVEAAVRLARSIVDAAPPGALRVLKEELNYHVETDWGAVRASVGRLPPAEWREGLGAFAEKRSPDYAPFWDMR